MKSWLLTYEARPWLLNSERSGGKRGIGGHYGRAALTSEWKAAFADLARAHRVPRLEWITVEVLQVCKDGRMPDMGNCFPAVKAAIDGIVAAGVIPDDKDPYLHRLSFVPPQALGYDALSLRIEGPPVQGQAPRPLRTGLRAKNRLSI